MTTAGLLHQRGKVQIAMLRDLEDSQYEPWQKYYVNPERLIPILAGSNSITTRCTSLKKRFPVQVASSLTNRFVAALDDEVDKAVVFFLDQQGTIARDLWAMWSPSHTATHALPSPIVAGQEHVLDDDAPQKLYSHAVHLLRLVKFLDVNIRIVKRACCLHDEMISYTAAATSWKQTNNNNNNITAGGIVMIEGLYLAGKIGRDAQAAEDHRRLSTLMYPDSLRATVGIAAVVYYRYIKLQEKLNGSPMESMRAVPSMMSLAGYLSTEDESSSMDYCSGEDPQQVPALQQQQQQQPNEQLDTEADDGGIPDSDEDGGFESVRQLVLSERFLTHNSITAASSAITSMRASEANLVGGVLLRIDTAMAKLTKTSSMMEYLACLPDEYLGRADSMLPRRDSTDDIKALGDILEEHEKTVGVATKSRKTSSYLNLANSFLYMVSYYLVAPTSSAYAKRLGLDESMSGAIIGMTAVAALASTVLYSWWTSHSYKAALICSSFCCLVGNLIYAAGLPLDSLTLVLVGRLLNGFGSARAINRRFIADAFSKKERTAASAAFVASGAAGMSVGPGLAAVMPVLIPKHSDNLWWQKENAAGWVMAGLWVIYLVFLIPYFEDPPKTAPSKPTVPPHDKEKLQNLYNGETKPLLAREDGMSHPMAKISEEAEIPLWKRPAALITIFLVFLLKLVLELVLSAAAPITGFYFDWSPSDTGWFLAALGLLVLPAIAGVTYASRVYEDRYLILYSVLGTLVGCLLMLQYRPPHYSSYQYILGTIILFVFPNTMEAPTMSLLSKNIPSSLSVGLFNLGFFTTEAGFSGRVVADSILTWCGSYGTEHLVNNVIGFLSVLNLVTAIVVYTHMHVLVDPAKKFN